MEKSYFDQNPPLEVIKEAMRHWRSNFPDDKEDEFSFSAAEYSPPEIVHKALGYGDVDAFWQAHFRQARWQLFYSRNESADFFRIDGEEGYCRVHVCLVGSERELEVLEPFERWAAEHFFDADGVPRRPRIILGHGAGMDWRRLQQLLQGESGLDIVPMETHKTLGLTDVRTVAAEGLHDRTAVLFYLTEEDTWKPESVASFGYSMLLFEQTLGPGRVMLVIDTPARKRLGERFTFPEHVIECGPRGGVVLRAKEILKWLGNRITEKAAER